MANTTKGKKAKPVPFNMAQAVRDVLTKHKDATGKEALELVKKAHPSIKINENSFGVAYTNGRKALGLSKGKAKARKAKATTRVKVKATANGSHMVAAATLVRDAGGMEQAKAALGELEKVMNTVGPIF